jgi:acetyl esterase/lipase
LVKTSKIIVSDPTRRKTLYGLPPEFPCFFDVINYLQERISSLQPKKVITTGTSAGGHTALLLGHLLKVDKAVAFAPYPYLSLKEARKRQDPIKKSIRRFTQQLDEFPDAVKPYLDLRPHLSKWNGKTEYNIHVSRGREWDYRRANYLRGCPHVSIIDHPFDTHGVAKELAQLNQLSQCFAH